MSRLTAKYYKTEKKRITDFLTNLISFQFCETLVKYIDKKFISATKWADIYLTHLQFI